MRYIIENAMMHPQSHHGIQRISTRYFQNVDVNDSRSVDYIKKILDDLGLPSENLIRNPHFRIDNVLFSNDIVHINFVPKWQYKVFGITYRKLDQIEKYFTASVGQAGFEERLVFDNAAHFIK